MGRMVGGLNAVDKGPTNYAARPGSGSVQLQAHFNTGDMLPDPLDQFRETFNNPLTPLIRKCKCDIPARGSGQVVLPRTP